MISLTLPAALRLQSSGNTKIAVEDTHPFSTVQTNLTVSKQELHSAIILNIRSDEDLLTTPPQLRKGKLITRQDFGLVLTNLIYLLKKMEQDSIRFSSEGMVASKVSVDRRADAIRKEGNLNCAAQISGAALNIGVSVASLIGMRDKSSKDSSSKTNLDKNNKPKLDEIDNVNKHKVDGINNRHVAEVNRLDKKYSNINKSDKEDITKLEQEISTLQRHNKKAQEAGFGDVDNGAINAKQKQIDLAKNNIANNNKAKENSIKELEAGRDKEINKVNAECEADKDKLISEKPAHTDEESYHKSRYRSEKYRLIGNLGSPAGQILTSAVTVFATEERAKGVLAEQESSVDNKTTDFNRDRASNYKSTATELINSIKTILQDRTNTAGEIIRRC